MFLKSLARNNQGFTLIETLIVVLLTGILAAIAAPSYVSWLENKKIDDVVTSVEGAIKEAQATSIRRSKPCTVTVTETSVSAVVVETPAPATPTSCLPSGTRTISATGSNRNIAVAVTNNTVKFTSQGTTLDTEPFIIYRSSGGNAGKMKCVVISSGLGMLRTGVYNATEPPTIPASLGPRPVMPDPPSSVVAAEQDAWDLANTNRTATINTVVSNCVSSS
ncbi:MAG: type II secretion system protein [Acaryochloridaceae cyanobacterium RU_4_10]|nr:type II secretion system protein [Acaryochloridaceae cyanobacterium RU_4_10]